jgi:hypothetical protein
LLYVLAVILFFVVLGASSVRNLSLTADEGNHHKYGLKILSLNSNRLGGDDSKMPVTALNGVPAVLASRLPAGAARSFLKQFYAARLVTILFSTLVALFVFHWARSLYGFPAGMAALILYLLDPNIIAHSQLVTTDIYATGAILITCYWLWKYAHTRRYVTGIVCALSLGLSLLTKYVALALIPLALVMLAAHDWHALAGASARVGVRVARVARRLLIYSVVAIVACLAVVNVGFLFNRTFMPFRDYRFQSPVWQFLRRDVSFLGHIPTPVPYPFLKGLDRVMYRERTGLGYGRVYLLGQLRGEGQGFAGYYFVASLLKVPIATQLVVLAALAMYFGHGRWRKSLLDGELFMLLPVVFFAIYFNFFYNAQIGIRYYLPVFPLLYVFSGSLFRDWSSVSVRTKWAVAALGLYLLGSVVSYYPQYLAYFNELVWNRSTAYKYLADSNLNWGQGQYYLKDYLSEHPGTVFEPQTIQGGHIVVTPDHLVGVSADPRRYAWLRDNFEPVGTVAYVFLVYDISPAQIEDMCRSGSACP